PKTAAGPDCTVKEGNRGKSRCPIVSDLRIEAEEVADATRSFPNIAAALVRLHFAYNKGLNHADPNPDCADELDDPALKLQEYIAQNQNFFPKLDEAAERLSERVSASGMLGKLSQATPRSPDPAHI
ncbi:hypothetical protein ACFSE1_16800, partial [Rhizobium helianthi]